MGAIDLFEEAGHVPQHTVLNTAQLGSICRLFSLHRVQGIQDFTLAEVVLRGFSWFNYKNLALAEKVLVEANATNLKDRMRALVTSPSAPKPSRDGQKAEPLYPGSLINFMSTTRFSTTDLEFRIGDTFKAGRPVASFKPLEDADIPITAFGLAQMVMQDGVGLARWIEEGQGGQKATRNDPAAGCRRT